MAFLKKAEFILKFNPDILIVPECENRERLKFKDGIQTPNDIVWFGENQHKGLGVFSYSDFTFKLLDAHNPEFKNILPIAVTGKTNRFLLLAVWANNPKDKDGAYVTQIWKAVKHYEHLISNGKVILMGDFNSNTIWDKPRREGNHSTLVEKLKDKNIVSAYHYFYNQTQGSEEHPTLFMYRHQDKPYHIDYCFASQDFIDNLKHVEIGVYNDWKHLSDHKPIIVDFH